MRPVTRGMILAAALVIGAVLSPYLAPPAQAGAPSDGVSISSFTVSPAGTGARTETETVLVGLNLTLRNSGQNDANITVSIKEKGRTLLARNVTIASNSTYNLSLDWPLQGIGDHAAVATISGDNISAPATIQATCNVRLLPLVEHPSPWYTIPCVLLFIIVPSVAIWLFIRRMRGGEWLDKTGNRSSGRDDKK